MINERRVVAVVPARGGSKGVPGKNLRKIDGVSLLHRTLLTANDSRYIDDVVVSSDDEAILQHAAMIDGVVCLHRPAALASDDSAMWPVIDHALTSTRTADIVVLLQPTSPLRETSDIDAALEKFVDSSTTSLMSVCPTRTSPFWMYRLLPNGRLAPILPKDDVATRQELPPTVQVNGALYIVDTTWFNVHHVFVDDETVAYVMPWERSIDVDSEEDLMLAELLITHRKSPVQTNDN